MSTARSSYAPFARSETAKLIGASGEIIARLISDVEVCVCARCFAVPIKAGSFSRGVYRRNRENVANEDAESIVAAVRNSYEDYVRTVRRFDERIYFRLADFLRSPGLVAER